MATTKRTHQVGTSAKPVEDDELLAEVQPVSLLERLKETLGKTANNPPLMLEVPNRPKMALQFDPNFEYETYQAWYKRAEDRKTKETNFFRLAVVVISNQNTGIFLEGEPTSMVITSPEIHEFLGVPRGSTAAAIQKMYGSDGHAVQAMKLIVEKAGYTMDGDVLEAEEGGPLDS
jgi:hypothetical protein